MSGDERSTWQKMKLNALELIFADKETQYEETVEASMDKAQGVDYRVGLLINIGTIIVGYGVYSLLSGLLAYVGIGIMVMGILPILMWVIEA